MFGVAYFEKIISFCNFLRPRAFKERVNYCAKIQLKNMPLYLCVLFIYPLLVVFYGYHTSGWNYYTAFSCRSFLLLNGWFLKHFFPAKIQLYYFYTLTLLIKCNMAWGISKFTILLWFCKLVTALVSWNMFVSCPIFTFCFICR